MGSARELGLACGDTRLSVLVPSQGAVGIAWQEGDAAYAVFDPADCQVVAEGGN
jgi:hypothetical protein